MAEQLTTVLAINGENPQADALESAAQVLRAGGLVAFPTETVYGLGANALDPTAVRRIFAAKGRPATNPLIIHVSDRTMLRSVVANWPPNAEQLAEQFWPGPLTLVLTKSSLVPDVATAGGPTVAVRMPRHPVALALIQACGFPLAAPSANRSTEISPTRAEHVLVGMAGKIDLILDGGPTSDGIESTVIDLTGDVAVLLRPGPIPLSAIESVIGQVLRQQTASEIQRSPGMMARHYSPRTPVELFESHQRLAERESSLRAAGEKVASVALVGSPSEYATRLYALLHELNAQGLTRILIELPPNTDQWLAVRDRLTRAAH